MRSLLLAFLFAFLFFLSHVICYRLKIMKFQPPLFLVLALIWFGVYLALLTYIGTSLRLSSLVLYGLLCLAYVAESTAIENESPSMKIMKAILRSRERHASFDELKGEFSERAFIHDRLEDLVRNGHILSENGLYRLSRRGALIASTIKIYRDLIRRGLGG